VDVDGMSRLGAILPKILVFAVAAGISFVVATAVMAATRDQAPESTVGMAPAYLLAGTDTPAGPGPVVAFNEAPDTAPGGGGEPLATPAPEDLDAAAAALLGGDKTATTSTILNPSGFPRIPPITQFDNGPFQGSNCTLASGAMLARLATGIVTSGSTLRTLQDDQEGGTDLNDLAVALWRGYGIDYHRGLLRPEQLKKLLGNGYGAVIQGIYAEIPPGLRLQRDFTGGHAVYLDGYYPGDSARGIPEAYYVIDPIGRPRSGYEGDWWPASVVDRFALAWGGSRIAAMWAFPPGGSPPEVVGPDVLPIPQGGGNGGSSASPEPGATPVASPSLGPVPADPGDVTVVLGDPPVAPVTDPVGGGILFTPVFDICLITPKPPGCPAGLEAVFDLGEPKVPQLQPGPEVRVLFADSESANTVIVAFTVDPPATADVKYWREGVSPAAVHHASSMTTMDVDGTPVILARLDVDANATYRFQAVAGDGLHSGVSEVGSFTTGSGVESFDVALAQAVSPVFKLEAGLSPYLHPAQGAFARPMLRLDAATAGSCGSPADFGGTTYCLEPTWVPDIAAPCAKAKVSWTLSGIDADAVLVRAFPVEKGVTPDGAMTLGGVIEASGPVPSGVLDIGCLASGLAYHIAIDAVGDDRGVLASKTVTVP
jgi:hypothetical protein